MQGFAPPQAGRPSDPAQGQAEALPYRRPFGGEPPEPEAGFDWRNLAASAAGAAGLAAILGSARFGGRFDQNAKLYREFIRNVSREGAPAVPASTGGEWVKRLLGGSWWHGTPATERVLEKGFAPEYEKMGLRFGEPWGVSLSADPRKASGFGDTGHNVLRVWPKVDPRSVLPVWADEAHEPLIKAYMQALEHRPNLNDPKTIRDFLAELNSGGWGMRYAANEMPSRYPHIARQFNQKLSEALEGQGIQGLLYNPHRYSEYEMRILDPRRAVPIEERILPEIRERTGQWYGTSEYEAAKRAAPMHRFADLKSKRVIAPYDQAIPYDLNKSLSEHYAKIPESQVLGPQSIPTFAEAAAKKPSPYAGPAMMGPDSYGAGNAGVGKSFSTGGGTFPAIAEPVIHNKAFQIAADEIGQYPVSPSALHSYSHAEAELQWWEKVRAKLVQKMNYTTAEKVDDILGALKKQAGFKGAVKSAPEPLTKAMDAAQAKGAKPGTGVFWGTVEDLLWGQGHTDLFKELNAHTGSELNTMYSHLWDIKF